MAYKQCGFCKYKVTAEEKYCPNCGFKNSWNIVRKWELEKYDEERIETIRKEGKLFKGLSLVFSGIFTFSATLFFFLFSLKEFSLIMLLSSFSAIISGFGASGFYIYYRTAFEFKNKRKRRYLINEEKMIYKRIKEIITKRKSIKNLQDRIQRSESKDDLKRTFAILTESLDHLTLYENRFKIELKKMQLIRWRNKFRPILDEWYKSNYEKGEQFLDDLEVIIEEGKSFLYSCSEEISVPLESSEKERFLESSEKGRFLESSTTGILPEHTLIKQIEVDLEIIFNLQKSLLNRQAQLSIQTIKPLETEQLYKKQAALFKIYIEKSTEYINAQSFLRAFEELENEYIRFQSEKDVIED